ncbi:MAG: fumarylacetoacetate hydrolase family protein [Bacteroidota bacterium]
MKIILRVFTFLVTLYLLPGQVCSQVPNTDLPEDLVDAAKRFEEAWKDNASLPSVRALLPTITQDEAYELQGVWVMNTLEKEEIGGVKAGVVTPGSQKTFGIDTPLSGILRSKGNIDARPKATIRLKDYPELVLETEIGFLIGKRIEEPPKSIEELKEYVQAIVPVIELAAGQWEKPEGPPSAVDYIAINLLASGVVIGKGIDANSLDPKNLQLSFSYNGEELHTASGEENWYGPWETALWMTEYAHLQGISLEPGHLIICGALGKVHTAGKGKYTLKAEPIGKIVLKIK